MAMAIGSGSGPSRDINVTPLIDVLLVLLIIFMVITPLTKRGEMASIPQPSTSPSQVLPPGRTVVLQVQAGASGQTTLRLNQEEISWQGLQGKLYDIYKTRAERVLFVQGDDMVEFDYVARAIDIAHEAGVEKVGLITARIEQGG